MQIYNPSIKLLYYDFDLTYVHVIWGKMSYPLCFVVSSATNEYWLFAGWEAQIEMIIPFVVYHFHEQLENKRKIKLNHMLQCLFSVWERTNIPTKEYNNRLIVC